MGLGDATSANGCGSANTIMEQANYLYQAQVTIPSTSDVAQVNRNMTQQSTCTESQKVDSGGQIDTPPPGGGGSGSGTPPPCVIGGSNCNNCVPPTCEGGYGWNPTVCSCYRYGSPIVIDTDGSGFHLTSALSGVKFDIFGDGNLTQIAWTAKGSTNGWLALDRDGNGVIDSGKELFGNITPQPPSSNPNGFLALAVFDDPQNGGNGDGVIDSHDAVWSSLMVWIDANHDGISQPDELHHLDEFGIRSIGLMYRESRWIDQYGNEFRYRGWLDPTRKEELDHTIYDVFLTTLDSQ